MTWLRTAWAALACIWLLSSCGGGDQQANGSGVGTGGTGSYANGPVTDFGSIVVNGIHFDPGRATITKAEQPDVPLTDGALQLGMMVEVEASPLAPSSDGRRTVAEASRITIVSQLRGVVMRDTLSAQGFAVMGQPVRVSSTTYMDAATLPQGLASLHEGEVVEVYGFHDVRTDSFVATRLVKPGLSTQADQILQGVVSDIDRTTGRCRIGHQMVYTFNTGLPADLREGQTIRVVLPVAMGPSTGDQPVPEWQASSLTPVAPTMAGLNDAALDGLVSDIEDGPRHRIFRVNGVLVDATALASCPACDSLHAGDRVGVRGTLSGGKVWALSVASGAP